MLDILVRTGAWLFIGGVEEASSVLVIFPLLIWDVSLQQSVLCDEALSYLFLSYLLFWAIFYFLSVCFS